MNKKVKAIVEEAMEEELWYMVANLAAAEEHAIESAKATGEIRFVDMADSFRTIRQFLVGVILPPKKLSEKGERTWEGESWCIVKHLLLAKIHGIETIQKLARMEGREEDIKIILDALTAIDHHRRLLKEVYEHGGFRPRKKNAGKSE